MGNEENKKEEGSASLDFRQKMPYMCENNVRKMWHIAQVHLW